MAARSTIPASTRIPRADARVNRERLVQAASVEVQAHGDKVPMADIAARAGVGVGTLYRHFPTRDALLGALTERAFEHVLERARACAEADGPAIDAIEGFLHGAIRDRGRHVLPLHGGPALGPRARELQAESRTVLAEILRRGRADGTIRGDVTPRDIVITAASLTTPLTGIEDWDRQARRLARVYVAGLRPVPSSS